jgi:hypothetical protein
MDDADNEANGAQQASAADTAAAAANGGSDGGTSANAANTNNGGGTGGGGHVNTANATAAGAAADAAAAAATTATAAAANDGLFDNVRLAPTLPTALMEQQSPSAPYTIRQVTGTAISFAWPFVASALLFGRPEYEYGAVIDYGAHRERRRSAVPILGPRIGLLPGVARTFVGAAQLMRV